MEKLRKIIITLAIAIVSGYFLLFAGKDNGSELTEPIKIGISAPLTGPVARFGEWSLNGVLLAIDEINNSGGVNGRTIELTVEDDECMSENAVSAVNKMQSIQGINKLIVVCTAPAPAVAPITKEKSIVFSPSFKVKALEEGDYPHYFSLQPSMGREVRKLMEYLEFKQYKKVGILYTRNDFWTSYKDTFIELAENNNFEIAIIESSDFLNNDFRTQLAKIKAQGVDVLFAGLNPAPLSNMLKQKEELGITAPIIGIWYTQTPDLLEAAGILAEGIVYSYHYRDYATPKNTRYTATYKERFDQDPEFASASTYDAVFILKSLIEKCGDSNIGCMINETNKIENYEGASGIITFSNGATLKEIYLKTIQNSQFIAL